MKFIVQFLITIVCIPWVTIAMEAPEKILSDALEKKCSISPHISRKRANSAVLEFIETNHAELWEQIREKRKKREHELQIKILKGEIITYRIGVMVADLGKVYSLPATIHKIFTVPNEHGLAAVDLFVNADQETALLSNQVVKTFTRVNEIPK